MVSVIPSEYAACPFLSNSSALLTNLTYKQDWWSYRQLRALQTNRFEGQLGHCPFYHPIVSLGFTVPTPIQIGTEHYFKWRGVDSLLTLVTFHLIIHPTFTFMEPLFNIAGNHLKNFHIIHCFWNDCLYHLAHFSHTLIHDTLHNWYPDQNLDLFAIKINNFITSYYKAVTPYSLCQDCYLNSPTPPLSTFYPCHLSSEYQ